MTFTPVEEAGVRFVEGEEGAPFLAHGKDAARLLEACFSARTRAALLYPPNLPPAFFDVSSGEAGELLQKLRGYKVRLAVVCAPGSATLSSRFNELLAAERRDRHFDIFETRAAACAWLAASRG